MDTEERKIVKTIRRLQVVLEADEFAYNLFVEPFFSEDNSEAVALGAVADGIESGSSSEGYLQRLGADSPASAYLELRFRLHQRLEDMDHMTGCILAMLPDGWKSLRKEELYTYLDTRYANHTLPHKGKKVWS